MTRYGLRGIAEGRSRALKARAAHGPSTEIDRGAAGRGPTATGARRDACRTRAQLRRGQEHDFPTERLKFRVLERAVLETYPMQVLELQAEISPTQS